MQNLEIDAVWTKYYYNRFESTDRTTRFFRHREPYDVASRRHRSDVFLSLGIRDSIHLFEYSRVSMKAVTRTNCLQIQ